MRRARSAYLLVALFAAIPTMMAFPGCAATTAAPTASRLTIVQGHLQSGAVGAQLPTAIVLRVLGTDGGPVQKIPVSLSVLAGGGTVDPATSQSDANGEVKAKWTLGPNSQLQALAASAPGVEPVTISALGILPSDLVVAQGNNQSAKASAALPVSIVLRVTGGANVPIPGVTIAVQIMSGGGQITPQSAVTNSLGEVSVRWTLGPVIGVQNATVTAGGLGPIPLSATAF
jgi:hypothetical protein